MIKSHVPKCLLYVFIVVSPITLIFFFPAKFGFYDSWNENLWVFQYVGEYLHRHWAFPAFINATKGAIGLPLPVFYGYTLYPIVGLFSAFIGSNLALRFSIIFLYFCQFFAVKAVAEKISNDRFTSVAISALSLWATFPLTNLYNRGAVPEMLAGAFLTLSVSLWFLILFSENRRERIQNGFLFAFATVMAVGVWPPATVQSIFIYLALFAFTLFWLKKNQTNARAIVMIFSAAFAFVGVVMMPWILVTKKYAENLWVDLSGHGLSFYDGIDNWYIRLSPFPLDYRSIEKGLEPDLKTPYLDAQVNIELFVLFLVIAFLIVRNFKKIREFKTELMGLGFSLIVLVYFSIMSISPTVVAKMPEVLTRIHFHYRFITFQNIALLAALFLALTILSKANLLKEYRKFVHFACIGLLGMSLQSIAIKNLHGASAWPLTQHPEAEIQFGPRANRDLIPTTHMLPGYFFGYRDIKTFNEASKEVLDSVKEKINVRAQTGEAFGIPEAETKTDIKEAGWVYVNMNPFLWNHLFIDGVEIPPGKMQISVFGIVTEMTAGPHTLRIESALSSAWMMFRTISYLLLMIGFACTCFVIASLSRAKLRS